jgi:hypothetical protein
VIKMGSARLRVYGTKLASIRYDKFWEAAIGHK